MSTAAEVAAAVAAQFDGASADRIRALLDDYGREPHERERERVQIAIVVQSAGCEDKLRKLIRMAKRDYRDVLAGPLSAAEGAAARSAAADMLERWGRKD